jgi:hypothetical protein
VKLPDTKTTLAIGITLTAMVGIIVLAVVIILTKDDAANTKAQSVFNAVLPLFGTWVGTVLAYYFSRDNFEVASHNTQQLVRQLSPDEKLRSIPVTDVMIKDIFAINQLDIKVDEIFKQLASKKVKRLPILMPSGALKALLYVEGILHYLYGVPETDRSKKTLEDLLKERPELNQKPAFVSNKATLADAKEAMGKIENCKMVIVTSSGDPNDPVEGILTNTDIAEHSRA